MTPRSVCNFIGEDLVEEFFSYPETSTVDQHFFGRAEPEKSIRVP